MNSIKAAAVCVVALFSLQAAAADRVVSSAVTANTPITLLSGGKHFVKDILFINGAVGTAQLRFYDSTANSTSVVRSAYTSYSQIVSNATVIHTNSSGIVVTNVYSGIATVPTSNASVTNERPFVIGPYIVATSGTRLIENVNALPANGLTLYATQTGTIEVVYEQVSP